MSSESETGLRTKDYPLSPPAVNEKLLAKSGESKLARSALAVLLATDQAAQWVTQAQEDP